MKLNFFIVPFFLAFVYAPLAFSDSHSQASSSEFFQHDWTGFYTGLMLGPQFGHSSDKTAAFGYNADNDEWNYNESGFNVGAELGYSYSFYGFLVGPAIELGYLGMEGSAAQPISPGADTVGQSSSNFYTAIRALAGFEFDRYLIFATGGAIGVEYTAEVTDNCDIAPCGGATIEAKKSSFVWGYTVGGGVERLFQKIWSIKFEYLYFSLGNQSLSGTTNLGNSYDWTAQTSGHIIRAGLNYHFNIF